MRWNLIIILVFFSAKNGQLLTIETGIEVHGPINLTTSSNDLARDTSDNPISNRSTREDSTGEHDTSEDRTSETSSTEEHLPIPPPSSEEETSVHIPSVESGLTQPRPSSEDTKPDSIENPVSGEKLSGENTESQGNVGGSSAGSRSAESNEGSSAVTISEEKLVQTTHGPVRGKTWQENVDIIGFIDIPYGKFNTPFEPPVTAQSWLDIHDVTQHTKICPQMHNDEYIGESNCLTLSIFTPVDKENVSVLFYIHDNNVNSISADPAIYGPEYLVPKGIVLVLPNYRLGPMGFLCLQNETAPGNAGLKDLALALEWVKENIYSFGGNPTNIVVSGDGVSGAYASYLALSSRSKHYVKKVITESGSALSHWALDRDPAGTAYELAHYIRNKSDDNDLDNTFEEASLETIVRAGKYMKFYPCLEGDREPFMVSTPWEMLHNKETDVTFMIGSAKYAGTHEAMDTTENFITQLNDDFAKFLPDDLIFESNEKKQEFAKKLKTQYFGVADISLNHVEELSLWYTDSSYLSPAIRLARPLLDSGVTVYFYEFAFVGDLNRELESMNKPVRGAVRSDIVGYLFHKVGTEVEPETPEEKMIHLIVDLWISFINCGKPAAENVVWNELKKGNASEEEWLLIDSEPKLEKGLHVDRMQLWTEIYNEYFIEGNAAFQHKPHYCVSVVVALMCWIANTKLNYSD